MPAGLQVINRWGTIQIDDTWRNYGFRSKFSATITAYMSSPPNPPGWNGMPYEFTTPGTPALLCACRASQLTPLKLYSFYNGTNWTFRWAFLAGEDPSGPAITETVDFYIFDAIDGVFSNVGLEVFTASGSRAFHSDAAVMRVGREDGGGVQPCNSGFTGTPGRIYAPLIMQVSVVGINVGFPAGYRLFQHCLRASGSDIVTSLRNPGAFGASGVYDLPGLYAAIDVTGLG